MKLNDVYAAAICVISWLDGITYVGLFGYLLNFTLISFAATLHDSKDSAASLVLLLWLLLKDVALLSKVKGILLVLSDYLDGDADLHSLLSKGHCN